MGYIPGALCQGEIIILHNIYTRMDCMVTDFGLLLHAYLDCCTNPFCSIRACYMHSYTDTRMSVPTYTCMHSKIIMLQEIYTVNVHSAKFRGLLKPNI